MKVMPEFSLPPKPPKVCRIMVSVLSLRVSAIILLTFGVEPGFLSCRICAGNSTV